MEEWYSRGWRWPSLEMDDGEGQDFWSMIGGELPDDEGAEATTRRPAHNPGQLFGSQSSKDITGDGPGSNRTTHASLEYVCDERQDSAPPAKDCPTQTSEERRASLQAELDLQEQSAPEMVNIEGVVYLLGEYDERTGMVEALRADDPFRWIWIRLPRGDSRADGGEPTHWRPANNAGQLFGSEYSGDITGDGPVPNSRRKPNRRKTVIEVQVITDNPQVGGTGCCRMNPRVGSIVKRAGQQSGSQHSSGFSGDGPGPNTTPATSPYGPDECWTSLSSAEQDELGRRWPHFPLAEREGFYNHLLTLARLMPPRTWQDMEAWMDGELILEEDAAEIEAWVNDRLIIDGRLCRRKTPAHDMRAVRAVRLMDPDNASGIWNRGLVSDSDGPGVLQSRNPHARTWDPQVKEVCVKCGIDGREEWWIPVSP